jgi:hypothetical protein
LLYYATEGGRPNEVSIRYLGFSSGRTTLLYRKEGAYGHCALAVSPDEKWILFTEAPGQQSEPMLMENFR